MGTLSSCDFPLYQETLRIYEISPYTEGFNFLQTFLRYFVCKFYEFHHVLGLCFFNEFCYSLHSLGFSEFPTIIRTSNFTALGILCFYEFSYLLRIWIVFVFSLQLEMLFFTSISSIMDFLIALCERDFEFFSFPCAPWKQILFYRGQPWQNIENQ